ncbi:uncharacterized protein LOC134262417 [Saccostrea cucullata]|uniref:uncharacterized protein LOC134262417 n=1 Tax=Saccostrea cuccullata TaxID=36930 RepID=UPI002ED52D30
MEVNQEKVNLGSKRKASIDDETEEKRKIPRSSDQTSADNNDLDLNARVSPAERQPGSTENKTQKSNQSNALNLWKITNESIRFEFTAETNEDDDNLAENDLKRNDKKSWDKDLPLTKIFMKNKTEYFKYESSIKKPESEESVVQEEVRTTATSSYGETSLKKEEQALEANNAAKENSLEGKYETTVKDESKVNEKERFAINLDVSNENSDDESVAGGKEEVEEQKPNEYVYRILRFDETYQNGLRPKNIFSRVSLQQHVERGSKGQESRFISCCKTLTGIRRLAGLTNKKHLKRDVVKINITKLTCRNRAEVIDLTREDIRARHISRSSDAWEYAEKFEEVIIEPTSHVPSECVEKIGVVHRKSFSFI